MEQWKDIQGYENLYQISNTGRVKSLPRYDDYGRFYPEKILKPEKLRKGYLRVKLGSRKDSFEKIMVHRLVAMAFIPNPDNLPQINHKNEDKSDNRVENLEWCDNSYNHNYGTRNTRATQHRKIKVAQCKEDGNIIRVFDSIKDAAIKLNICAASISKCVNKIPTRRNNKNYFITHVGGYKWKSLC